MSDVPTPHASVSPPASLTPPPRRAHTFLGRLGEAVRAQNWFAVALEVAIVVTGVFIGMQVSNWNERRKQDEQFRFALRELYDEVFAISFQGDAVADKMGYQLALIDSLLQHPDEVAPERLPAMIEVLDSYGLEVQDLSWKTDFLEFRPGDEERNQIAKTLRTLTLAPQGVYTQLEVRGLDHRMERYLQDSDVPLLTGFPPGTPYTDIIQGTAETADYTPRQLARVTALLNDESFIADLMTIRAMKEGQGAFFREIEGATQGFLAVVRGYVPDVDFSLQHIEIIGNGVAGGGDFTAGVPMATVPDDDGVWEIEQDLVDGRVRFRANSDWVLDWGRGELAPDRLVFKGSDIPVTAGRYRIRIDIREGTMEFTPIDALGP